MGQYEYRKFFINGEWTEPDEPRELAVINPATEQPAGVISLGNARDVDRAAAAARQAFAAWSRSGKQERLELIDAFIAAYKVRYNDMAAAITAEMGAPKQLSTNAQVAVGLVIAKTARRLLEDFDFEEQRGATLIRREPIGVCGFITPWNWPVNQIALKVLPALASGCTMVLKPSEIAPFSGIIFAEVMEAAGVPAGVFNLVNGDGPEVGQAIAAHPAIDMVSFTGSTRGGIAVAATAAGTVKRVSQELGGKSPSIILDEAILERGVASSMRNVCSNTGQSCNAPTRLLVPEALHDKAVEVAAASAARARIGDPESEHTTMGPLVSEAQFNKVQHLIQQGIDEDAELAAGGAGRPEGLERGYYVKPTVFAKVSNDMAVAREEIFGPVLCVIPYRDLENALAIANDTEYGLAAYVWSSDLDQAREVAARLRAGQVSLNGNSYDAAAPFGGYKQSGNGRESGPEGLEEFLETKAILGYEEAA
ncbi:MAG: aldehyde dehydrogenase family protein [Gammaproteobacteria bacterium]|nr:aldehyde dehydrogenase family protein [Gammaproteobacteria bacterium]